MVKKSKGFSWGPAATGCSYWTGVRMSTLLRKAGVHTPDQVTTPLFYKYHLIIYCMYSRESYLIRTPTNRGWVHRLDVTYQVSHLK